MNRYNYYSYNNLNKCNKKETFLISYAVRGPTMIDGTQYDIPVIHPIEGPVSEPSPLNTRYKYDIKFNPVGVL
jgi:hypothetical protein